MMNDNEKYKGKDNAGEDGVARGLKDVLWMIGLFLASGGFVVWGVYLLLR